MKKLFFLLIIFAGCKPDPLPTPVTPAQPSSANWIKVTGDGHSNQVYEFAFDTSMYDMPSGLIRIISGTQQSPWTNFNLLCASQATGSFPCDQYSAISIENAAYGYPNITVTITQYDTIGGQIRGEFSGTAKKASDTTVVIQVNGKFDCTRGPDQ